jgi:hypothetical protein
MVVEGEPPVARMPAAASKEAFYLCSSEEVAAWAVEHERPNPLAPFAQPVALDGDAFERIPRRYVLSTQDKAIPPALQRRMSAEGGCNEVVELDTDHVPQLSATAELAEVLDRWAG